MCIVKPKETNIEFHQYHTLMIGLSWWTEEKPENNKKEQKNQSFLIYTTQNPQRSTSFISKSISVKTKTK